MHHIPLFSDSDATLCGHFGALGRFPGPQVCAAPPTEFRFANSIRSPNAVSLTLMLLTVVHLFDQTVMA